MAAPASSAMSDLMGGSAIEANWDAFLGDRSESPRKSRSLPAKSLPKVLSLADWNEKVKAARNQLGKAQTKLYFKKRAYESSKDLGELNDEEAQAKYEKALKARNLAKEILEKVESMPHFSKPTLGDLYRRVKEDENARERMLGWRLRCIEDTKKRLEDRFDHPRILAKVQAWEERAKYEEAKYEEAIEASKAAYERFLQGEDSGSSSSYSQDG